YVFGRAVEIRLAHDFVAAFGMHEDADARVFPAPLVNVARQEAAVNRTESLPQNQLRLAQLLRRVAAEFEPRVPDRHFVERDIEFDARVAPEVFVGEEE